MALYLVHLDEPFGHARHYLGYTNRQDGWRLRCHAKGTGSNLLKKVRAAGIGWQLVRVWPDWPPGPRAGSRTLERRIKDSGTSAKVCPLCVAAGGHRYTAPDGRWLTRDALQVRRCRCGARARYRRPWGRGTVPLCPRCAGRYMARVHGATDAELAAGTYSPEPERQAA